MIVRIKVQPKVFLSRLSGAGEFYRAINYLKWSPGGSENNRTKLYMYYIEKG